MTNIEKIQKYIIEDHQNIKSIKLQNDVEIDLNDIPYDFIANTIIDDKIKMVIVTDHKAREENIYILKNLAETHSKILQVYSEMLEEFLKDEKMDMEQAVLKTFKDDFVKVDNFKNKKQNNCYIRVETNDNKKVGQDG